MPKIEIYTGEFCPYCDKAKAFLEKRGLAFQEIQAPKFSPARQEAQTRSGGRTSVPQIFINDRSIGGYDEMMALVARGEFDRMLAA